MTSAVKCYRVIYVRGEAEVFFSEVKSISHASLCNRTITFIGSKDKLIEWMMVNFVQNR